MICTHRLHSFAKRTAFVAWLLLFSVFAPSASAQLSVDQVDYYQDQVLTVQDSFWGEFHYAYTPSTLLYLNVVEDPGGIDFWVIQNAPLFPASPGSDFRNTSVYFDLGISNGVNVSGSSYPILWTVTTSPLTSAPSSGTNETLTIGTSQAIINNGVPSLITSLNAPTNPTVSWTGAEPGEDEVCLLDMPNVTQELNFCGPGAAANSMHYLFPNLTQTLEDTQTEIAAAAGNNNDGNWDDTEVQAKLAFNENHDLNLEVHYTGGEKLPGPGGGNYTDPGGNGTARNDGAFNCKWLLDQIKMGQDVELMTATHWVVVSGILVSDDICVIEYRDDNYQHGNSTTMDERDELDDRYTVTHYDSDTGKINIGNGEEPLLAAVAESPRNTTPALSAYGIAALALLFVLLAVWIFRTQTKEGAMPS